MTPDSELLAAFARTNSEDAFAEVVKRHVNLVYSAALRQVNGDAHLAQDVAQTVFTDLAKKANSLSRRENLSGWLYTSAHFAAAKIVRTETRRRDREEKFMREPTNELAGTGRVAPGAPEAEWENLRPALDAAMHELKEADREAILLRYFENRPFAEVGAKLGLNENAARTRVDRALEKLRAVFARQGIAATATLASVISANAVQLAPAGLAATLTTASIVSAGTGTFTLLKIMTATKLKLGISALVVAGTATALVVQHQAQEQLRADNVMLTQQIAQLQTDNASLSNRLGLAGDSKSLPNEQFNELLKLRGEVGLLRQRTNDLGKLREDNQRLQSSLAKVNQQAHQSDAEADSDKNAARQAAISKMNDAKLVCLGFIMYASDHQGQLPSDFNEISQTLTNGQPAFTGTNQFEIVAQGLLAGITNPSTTILIRETEAHQLNGNWVKAYGFADGHAELKHIPQEGFDVWEKERMVPPSPNQ